MVDTTLAATQRHPHYYLTGGDLHFLIENIFFRVHRYFFERESSHFRPTPAAPGEAAPGESESCALVFEDVKTVDLERLLWVFYNPKYSIYDASIEEWTSILFLSDRWNFHEVKALAVRELEKLQIDDIDRIVLYHKYKVDKTILIPRYASLCARSYHLTTEEGNRLGIEATILLSRARECARCKSTSGEATPVPEDFKEEDMNALITDIFQLRALPQAPSSPARQMQNGQHPDPSGSKPNSPRDDAKAGPSGKNKYKNKSGDGSGSLDQSGRGKDKDKKKQNHGGRPDDSVDSTSSEPMNGDPK